MGSLSKKPAIKKATAHQLSWFEIPAFNIHRVVAFYNTIYGIDMEIIHQGNYSMAMFPKSTGIEGAVVMGPGCIPSELGTLVYLQAGQDLSEVLKKVVPAGGRIVMEKTLINEESGYFALLIDSEGNKIALQSPK